MIDQKRQDEWSTESDYRHLGAQENSWIYLLKKESTVPKKTKKEI